MDNSVLSKARYFVLLLLVFLITISSHPTIVTISKNAGMASGTILSRYIIVVFAALFLLCLNIKSMFASKIIRVSWAIYILILVSFFATYAAFGKDTMNSDARSIAICLAAIMIGWQLRMNENKANTVMLLYSGLTLFVGLMQINTNIGGFQILDQYQTDNKNALGVMLSTGGTVFLMMGMKRGGGIRSVIMLLLFSFSIVILLTIRARTATLALIIAALYVLYERFRGKYFLFYFFLGIAIVVVVYLLMPSVAKEYIYNSFFQHREDDFTSGRMERNIIALDFLSEHFFLGDLNQDYHIARIHNYLLNRAFEFGFFFVLPIVFLYFYLLLNTVLKTIRSNCQDIQSIGYFLLLIPFIISMAEYSFPYGPGTATVFNFIMFGQALRMSNGQNSRVSLRH